MKKLFFISAIILLQSCTKENIGSRPLNYIKATIDGEEKQFSFAASASSTVFDSTYTISIIAGIAAGTLESMELNITRYDTSIDSGLYNADTSAGYTIFGAYTSPDDTGNKFTANNIGSLPSSFQINITEADSIYFKGSFSGTFYDSSGAVKKIISDGEFSLQF